MPVLPVTTDILPDFDLRAAVRHLKRADPALATVITQVGPCRLRLRPQATPFEALLRAITYQQLSGKAAATIHGRLMALFPGQRPDPGHLLQLPDTALRAAGLSRNKILAVRDLAQHTQTGRVPDSGSLARLTDEEIVVRLTGVRGVGRWTVEMLLIFTLGRPDVLPLDDLGVRKGFRLATGMRGLPARSTLERAGRRWAPYRSVASWYLWRILD